MPEFTWAFWELDTEFPPSEPRIHTHTHTHKQQNVAQNLHLPFFWPDLLIFKHHFRLTPSSWSQRGPELCRKIERRYVRHRIRSTPFDTELFSHIRSTPFGTELFSHIRSTPFDTRLLTQKSLSWGFSVSKKQFFFLTLHPILTQRGGGRVSCRIRQLL